MCMCTCTSMAVIEQKLIVSNQKCTTLAFTAHLTNPTGRAAFAFWRSSDGFGGCDIEVAGGTFTCQCTKNGAFMFASDGALVSITGGFIENNVATRRAGAVSDPAA